ncbi:FUSC family protein [Pyxidicoccus xibeiensis]|uniref:FUSC family protein n=1 Tax=Pyxidicoccus xibeiensis TaxID=2906759 RepID=UPI0020A78985|nr:FUSC family protein [Pyxidicoccus xibeiensis]MCP3138912.1 FUSC family protein [Pyxidicoccus xibeiensis]
MSSLRRHLVSFLHVEPGRPALGAGLRAALAVGVPMVAAAVLHLPAATWMGMAGLFVALVDRGGPYRERALTMGTLTVLGAWVSLGSAFLHLPSWAAVVVTLCWVAACGFLRSYGDTPGLMGVVLANYGVVSLALPAKDLSEALVRGGLFLVGGAWAMLLALLLWPLRPYRPVRLAIARCYREVAARADAVSRWPLSGPDAQVPHENGPGSQGRVRQQLEAARAALASTRRGRAGESGRGEHMLVLLEGADALLPALTALTETLELAPREPRYHALRAEVQRALGDLASDGRRIARALEKEWDARESSSWDVERVHRALSALDAEGEVPMQARAAYAHAGGLLRRLREYSRALLDVAARLEEGGPMPADLPVVPGPGVGAAPKRSWLGPLRDNLGTGSVIFRHALRLGIAAALATALIRGLGLNHGYWVIITVIVVLQPYSGLTFQRGLQRAAGTLLGAALAAGLVALVKDPGIILLAIVVLFAIAISVQPLSLSAFQVLLTPALVLLAELQSGDWDLAGVRILNTLLGGVLALASARLLWPSPEHLRFPEQVASALRADRDYLRQVATARSDAEPAVREARRRLGLELLSAEASFQRLLAEWRGPARQLEPVMALLTYARRFGTAVTALAASRRMEDVPDLSPVTRYAGRVLDELATAVEQRRVPAPLPPGAPLAEGASPGADVLSRTQVERLVRQLSVLHHAAERLPPGLLA